MEKKKFIILALVLIGLVLVSGCSTKKAVETGPASAFIGGTDGLVMSFVQDAPPSEYPQQVPFDVIINVENRGESTVNASTANILLGGISNSSYGLGNPSQPITDELPGKQLIQKTTTPGGVTQVTFSSKTGSPPFPGSQPQKITATLCYHYTTEVQGTVCIQPSLARQTVGGAQLCTVTGSKTVYSSGAPVKITSLSESATSTGNKITGFRFTMFVQNEGSGTAYVGDTCPPTLGDANRVKVISAKLVNLDKDLDCGQNSPTYKGVLIAGDNGGVITCTADSLALLPTDIFEDVLVMQLGYGYTQSITKSITFTTT
jgi:hypothetical protein